MPAVPGQPLRQLAYGRAVCRRQAELGRVGGGNHGRSGKARVSLPSDVASDSPSAAARGAARGPSTVRRRSPARFPECASPAWPAPAERPG